MKIISWNIDSLNAALTGDSPRALMSKAVLNDIAKHDADIIALQETKLSDKGPTKKHLEHLEEIFKDYKIAWRSSCEDGRRGYSGTMFLYKNSLDPVITMPKIGAPHPMDCEGRTLTLEFEGFFVTQVYTPNAGDELKRLSDRQLWDRAYTNYLKELDSNKPVIAMGDFNVAHKEIDLANPDGNHFTPGFTDEERDGFTLILQSGFTDTFRYKNGDITGAYTWWSQRVKTSKINNRGWRIDYFLTSDRIKDLVINSEILSSGDRQDHTPIMLEIII